MANWDETTLTERQRRWFASVREGLERDTGRSLGEWAEIARACPQTGRRARLVWLKTEHGLRQNRAMQVLSAAFPSAPPDPDLPDPLWVDDSSRAVFDAVARLALSLPEILVGRRKSYTAFSRRFQFAAVRPTRDGGALLGLATSPHASPRLSPPTGRAPWSERLTSVAALPGPDAADEEVLALLRESWERS